MNLAVAEIDLLLDILVVLILLTNLLVLGKALEIIDCMHDYMHDVLDNIVPIHVDATEEVADAVKLWDEGLEEVP
jgi:hypothetical protein|tara:strand:- start:2316 stop:2540 length:225 start_codon:yes stop_codon:yes gene_type:complete